MQSNVVSVSDHFTVARFAPARVQRTFQWDDEQCSTLVSDLLKAWRPALPDLVSTSATPDGDADLVETESLGETDHSGPPSHYYLGPIIIRREGPAFEVFDGLQRTTALTILLSVLRDLLRNSDADLSRRLDLCINDGAQPRLDLGILDKTLSEKIQTVGEAVRSRKGIDEEKFEKGRILRAAAAVVKNLKPIERNDLAAFATFVLDRALICRVEVEQAGLARQIFVTTNSRGLALNEADVFKSQLASVAQSAEAEERILMAWCAVDDDFGDKSDFVNFLRTADTLTRRRWPGGEGLTQLGEWLVRPGQTEESLMRWLSDLHRWARAWRQMHAARSPKFVDPFEGDLRRLFLIEWPEWKPLALLLYSAYLLAKASRKPTRAVERRFHVLHKRCIALSLLETTEQQRQWRFLKAINSTANGRNPMVQDLALTEDQKARARLALEHGLPDRTTARMFTRWYESMLWGADLPADIFRATTEHVLPVAFVPGSDWYREFGDEVRRADSVSMIGNFVCLTEEDNRLVDRKDFPVKCVTYAAPTFAYRTLGEALQYVDWTPAAIQTRSRKMSAWALERLDL